MAESGTLVQEAAGGDAGAFEEMYRLYSVDANRVAWSVTHNPHDAADAVAEAFTRVFTAVRQGRRIDDFRAYLLTATRHAAVDLHRKSGREHSDDEIGLAAIDPSPDEEVIDLADTALVTEAFSDLPERWQEVLWLTQIEEVGAREAAARMGMSTNALGQLAFRARAKLRERYVQAHLGAVGEGPCRATVERLGTHALGALPPGEQARVEEHLEGCAACRGRLDELSDLSATLRRALVPLPIGLALARFGARLGLGPADSASSILRRVVNPVGGWQRAGVAAAAAVLFVAGLVALFDSDGAAPGSVPPFTAGRTDQAPADEPVPEPVVLGARVERARRSAAPEATAAPTGTAVPARAPAHGAGSSTGSPSAPPAPPSPTPPPDPLQVVVKVKQNPAATVVAVGLGEGGCTGVRVASLSLGCTTPSATPDIAVSIPELVPLP